jgi:hypothetical protein
MTANPAERRSPWPVAVGAAAGGVLLGVADLAARRVVPFPWAHLANSGAVWAVGAYAAGAVAAGDGIRERLGRWQSAIAGLVVLLVAVESYYVAAALWLHNPWSNLWQPSTLAWLLFGAVAGPVFGAAGGWSRSGSPRLRIAGAAFPAAVLFADVAIQLDRGGNRGGPFRTDIWPSAVAEAAVAVLLILIAGRTFRQRAISLASSVPLTAIGFGLFLVTGRFIR